MTTRLKIIFGCIFLFAGLTAMAQSPQDLIDGHLKAIGGAKAFKKLNSVKREGTLKMPAQGVEAKIVFYSQRPDKARQEIELQGNTVVQAGDGKVSWLINPFLGTSEPKPMPEDFKSHFERANFFDDLYFGNAEKRGVKLAYEGKVHEDDKDYQHVMVTFKDGHEQHRYFDPETGLLAKVRQLQPNGQGGELEVTVTFGEWETVEGIKFPKRIEASSGQIFIFDKVEINPELEGSLFSMPQ